MSDLNCFSGEILIDPPLSWAEIRNGPSIEDVELRLAEVAVDTDQGRITTVTATAIIPCEGRYDGRHAVRDIQAIVDAHGATHEFTGWIQMQPDLGYGESTPVRYVVRDGRVETVTPRLVWPGEDDELLDDARALAILCRDVLKQMPVGMDEFLGLESSELPGWFVGYDNGRELSELAANGDS